MADASGSVAADAGPAAGAGPDAGVVRPDEQAAANAAPKTSTAGRKAGCTIGSPREVCAGRGRTAGTIRAQIPPRFPGRPRMVALRTVYVGPMYPRKLLAAGVLGLIAAAGCRSTAPADSAFVPGFREASAPEAAPNGMVWIPGGRFWMACGGCNLTDALPVHALEVDGFWMDRAPVTNAEFARFADKTGYVT